MNTNNANEVGSALAAIAVQSWPLAALGAAVDLAETAIGMQGLSAGVEVGSVYIVPTGALTSSDTLFRTITVAKRTAGGAATTIATATTKTTGSGGTGDWTAFKAVAIPVTAGAFIAAGDVITVTITHASTGTAIPASQLEVFPAVQ